MSTRIPGSLPGMMPGLGAGWKPWMSAAAGLILVVAGGAAYLSRPNTLPVTASHLYTVGYGNIDQTLATAGTLEAPQHVALTFLATGRVASVNVKVGETVTAGQVLAKLDDSTIKPAVASAQAAVSAAQANLLSAENPATPQAVAVAQAAVQHAQVALQGAEQAYTDAQAAYNDPSLKQSVVAAQTQVAADAAAVQSAQAGLSAAQVKLQQIQAGVSTSALTTLPTTIAADQQALSADQEQLTADQKNLANAQHNLQVDQAQQTQDKSLYSTMAAQYPQDEAAYQQALQDYQNASGYPVNPYASVLQQTQVTAMEAQTAYNTLQNDTKTVDADQVALLEAQKSVQADTAAVQGAQAALTAAQNQQSNLQTTNPLTVQAAQDGVDQAQSGLAQAQAAYQGAQNSLTLAQEIYKTRVPAKAALDQSANDVSQAKSAVQQAQAQLSATQAPLSAGQIAAAQAQVQSAQAALQSAQANEANTRLVAPISGVVVAVNGTPGSNPPVGEPMITLQDAAKTDLQVNLTVSQTNVTQVRAGQSLAVTVPAFPGKVFNGTVVSVSPASQVINNVTEYSVVAVVHNPNHRLTPGMTAQVNIDTASHHHVLIVPKNAVQTAGNVTGVYVYNPKSPKAGTSSANSSAFGLGLSGGPAAALPSGVIFQPVEVGLEGAQSVEIVSGLKQGSKVLTVPPN